MIKDRVMAAFRGEFHFIAGHFEIIDLLDNSGKMDWHVINKLKLPRDDYNIVWHPGVYLFLGDEKVYRVGVSMQNSRKRVMEHLDACTSQNGYGIWDINKHDDKSILLFNVKDPKHSHWLLALEVFLEREFKPLIKAKRVD